MTVATRKPKTRTLTIFLIKEDCSADAILKPGRALQRQRIVMSPSVEADLYIQPSVERSPSWLDLFSGVFDAAGIRVANESAAALLVAEAGGRKYALAFGQGRHLLQPSSYEETFGLKVVLNAVDPEGLKTIDRERLSEHGRRSRDQVARESEIGAFGIDVEQDMLRAVTGRPKDPSLGHRLSGADSLTASLPIALADIPEQLGLYGAKFTEASYRERFAFVDHVREVRDPAVVHTLNQDLIRRLRAREIDDVWIAVPQILDLSRVQGFKYRNRRDAAIHPDLHVRDLLDAIAGDREIAEDDLRKMSISAIDAETDGVVDSWPVGRCLYAELLHGGSSMVLTNGRWYRVDPDFASRVNEEIATLLPTAVRLPNGRAGEHEAAYNKRAVESDPARFALMDRVPIGAGQIEFCDIYSREGVMIHVKRYAGSSVLSHLFAQGTNAATLFAQDSRFREQLNDKLPGSHKLPSPADRPQVRDFEVAFCVVSRSAKPLRLPFFSRLSLRNAARVLQGYGYRVSYTKVPLEASSKKELAA